MFGCVFLIVTPSKLFALVFAFSALLGVNLNWNSCILHKRFTSSCIYICLSRNGIVMSPESSSDVAKISSQTNWKNSGKSGDAILPGTRPNIVCLLSENVVRITGIHAYSYSLMNLRGSWLCFCVGISAICRILTWFKIII